MVRDVCLLNYENMVYWTYRLYQVLRIEISTNGQVRTVKVGYEEGHGSGWLEKRAYALGGDRRRRAEVGAPGADRQGGASEDIC